MIDPKSLRYTPSHEWVHLDGDIATVGISRFAVDQLTDLILIDLSKAAPGRRVEAGKAFGEIESVKAVADLYSPVNGEIVAVNPSVSGDVQLLAQDPYNAGWLLQVKVDDPNAVAKLLDYEQYQKTVDETPDAGPH
jgi:glycine cleavage system H protein